MSERAETILLVEDESVTRWMAARALRRAGYTVLEAGCLVEAREQVTKCCMGKTIFVIDAYLPDAKGGEVADVLHRDHPQAPVLFLSGYTAEILDAEEWEKEGTSVLSRLFTPDVLVRRVRQLLDGSLPTPMPAQV